MYLPMSKGVFIGLFLRPNLDAFRPGIDGMLFHGLQVSGILGFGKEFLVSFKIVHYCILSPFVF